MKTKFLVNSGRRYYLDTFGNIFDSNNKAIPATIIDGERWVRLSWVLGDRLYNQAWLSFLTWFSCSLEEYYWDRIDMLYLDGNRSNLSPDNLFYKFGDPVEIDEPKGFFIVPGFTKYAISEDGDLVAIDTGYIKKWGTIKPCKKRNSKGGYQYTRVVNDIGKSVVLFKHRAICMVFKDYDNSVFNMVVNHLDGDPSNNKSSNLEWCDYRHNNNHALNTGLRVKVKRVYAKNILTGETMEFNSARECGAYFGFKSGDPVVKWFKLYNKYPFMEKYMLSHEEGVFDEPQEDPRRSDYSVSFKDVLTDEITHCKSTSEATLLASVDEHMVRHHLLTKSKIPVNGYIFRYSEGDSWPVYNDDALRVFKQFPSNAQSIALFELDVTTGEETIYRSIKAVCKKRSISRPNLNRIIANDITVDGKFKYRKVFLFT